METHAKLFLTEHRTRGSSPRTIEGYGQDLSRFRSWLQAEQRLRVGGILAEGRPIEPDEVAAAEQLAHALDALLTPND